MPDRAILAILLSSLLFGASTPLARALVGEMDPRWLAGALYAGSGIGLSLWLVVRRRDTRNAPLIERADLGWLAAAILCGGVLAPVAFAFGLRVSTGAAASLLLNLETVFTVALAWFLFGEHRNARVVAGMALIVVGCALLGWRNDSPSATAWTGVALIALACALWAVDNNLTRKVAANDAVAIAAAKGVIGGAVNLAVASLSAAPIPAVMPLFATAAVGLAGYGISLVLFVIGMRGLGVARASAYYGLAPFIGVAVAFALLGEAAPLAFWPALALTAAGVWLHLTEQHDHLHTHVPIAHAHSHVHDEHHRHSHDFAWDGREPHVHPHEHAPLRHRHAHFPDLHHRDHSH